jgi:site-specific recombinase XerD
VAESLENLLRSFRRDLRADGKAPRSIELYSESVRFYIRWLVDGGGRSVPPGGQFLPPGSTAPDIPGVGILPRQNAPSGASCRGKMPTPDLPPPDITALNRENIRGWLAWLRDQGRAEGTRRARFAGLRRFCRWAAAEGYLPASPMDGMTPPEPVMDPVPVLAPEAVAALLKACAGKGFYDLRDAAMIRVLYDSGMRIGELAHIEVDDVDFDLEVIVVTGKGSRVRACPFGARTARAIDRYLRARRGHRLAHLNALWLSQRGPCSTNGIDNRLKLRARQAGLPPIHAHQFRHTFSHNWLAAGGQERDLMRLNGWRSPSMLARYGASLADQRARDAHRRIAPGDRL